MINETFKKLLLSDLNNAKTVDDVKVILGRLITGIESEEDKKKKFIDALMKIMN
jgi:hypothetical protein